MHISDRGIKIGEEMEGKRYVPYDDGCGNMTVGIGHLIQPSDNFTYPLTDEQVYEIYRKDIGYAEAKVKKNVTVEVTQNQFDVLTDMAFNMKYFSFMNSSVVRLLNEGKPDEAAERLFRYNKAFSEKQQKYIVMGGLTKRCKLRYDLWKSVA
jgi:GH24 family phage-related lysozyme (muramidase)